MKKLAVLLLGFMMLTASTGCCWNPWYGYGYQGYPGGYGGACPGGNCQYGAPQGYPQSGAMFGVPNATQANYPPVGPAPIAQQPFYPSNPMTAMGPHSGLPTY